MHRDKIKRLKNEKIKILKNYNFYTYTFIHLYYSYMNKIVLLKNISKQYLSVKQNMRSNKKAVSMFKLTFVSIICLAVFWFYAYTVTISSTKGYFLAQKEKIKTEKEFDLSIAKLDVLQLEQKVYQEVQDNQSNFRYDDKENRFVEVKTYKENWKIEKLKD